MLRLIFGASGLTSAYGLHSGFRRSGSANAAAPQSAHTTAAAAGKPLRGAAVHSAAGIEGVAAKNVLKI